jgi:YVTN family beta-propeller protein
MLQPFFNVCHYCLILFFPGRSQRFLLILAYRRRRITAWNQIQKKKKEGKYPTICSDSICTDESFTVLEIVLMLLEAGAKAVWDRQAIAYVTNGDSDTVSVITTDSNEVIDTIPMPVRIGPSGVAITPDGTPMLSG